jgi:hypothetical protein
LRSRKEQQRTEVLGLRDAEDGPCELAHRRVALAACAGERVADMDHAVEVIETAVANGVALVRRVDDPIQCHLRRQSGLEPVDVERGYHDVARLTIGEIKDVVQQLLLRPRDHTGPLRLVDQRAQLGGNGDPLARHHQQDARGPLQDPHHRPQRDRDQLDRTRDQHRQRFRTIERQRFGHQLTKHDGEVGDKGKGDHECHPAREPVAQDLPHRGLGQRAEQNADGGDAELRAGAVRGDHAQVV